MHSDNNEYVTFHRLVAIKDSDMLTKSTDLYGVNSLISWHEQQNRGQSEQMHYHHATNFKGNCHGTLPMGATE